MEASYTILVLDLVQVAAPAVALAVAVVVEHTCGKFVSLLPNNNLVQHLFRKLDSKCVCLVFGDSVANHHSDTSMLSMEHALECQHLASVRP